MTLNTGQIFRRVGGLALIALLLAACGNDTAVPSPSPTTAAATTAAATPAPATTAAPTTTAVATLATVTTGANATANAVATGGAAVEATPANTPAPGVTPTPSPIGGIATPTGSPSPAPTTAAPTGPTAAGELKDATGKSLGTVMLTQTSAGVMVKLTYNGLPAGDHGIHFHSIGKCEAPDFASAGAHFNPENMKHGLKATAGPHAGDMPDLVVNSSLTGVYEATNSIVTLTSGPDQLIGQFGAALVVHAKPDDQMTDPSGMSGDRIACAVLVLNTPNATPSGTPVAAGTPGTPGASTTPGTVTTITTAGTTTPGATVTAIPTPTAAISRGTTTPGGTPGTPAAGTTTPGGTPGPSPTR